MFSTEGWKHTFNMIKNTKTVIKIRYIIIMLLTMARFWVLSSSVSRTSLGGGLAKPIKRNHFFLLMSSSDVQAGNFTN
jgi:hypothetical protein